MDKESLIDRLVSELMRKPMNKAEIMNMFNFSLRSCDIYIAKIQDEKEIPIKKQNIKKATTIGSSLCFFPPLINVLVLMITVSIFI